MSTFYWSSTGSTAIDPTTANSWTKDDGTTGVPTTGDTAYIQPIPGVTLAPIKYSDQSAVTLAALYISAGLLQTWYAGTTDTSSANYYGYWKIGCTGPCVIGQPVANAGTGFGTSGGAGRIKINFGSTVPVVTVYGTGQSLDSGLEPVRLLINSSSAKVYVYGGTVGIGTNLPADTSTVGTITVDGSESVLDLGAGVTVTTAQATDNGTLFSKGSIPTTLTVASGSTATLLSGASGPTTVNNYGTCYLNNRNPATTLNAYSGSITDFSGSPATGTITTANIYSGSTLRTFSAVPGQITITTLNRFDGGSVKYT